METVAFAYLKYLSWLQPTFGSVMFRSAILVFTVAFMGNSNRKLRFFLRNVKLYKQHLKQLGNCERSLKTLPTLSLRIKSKKPKEKGKDMNNSNRNSFRCHEKTRHEKATRHFKPTQSNDNHNPTYFQWPRLVYSNRPCRSERCDYVQKWNETMNEPSALPDKCCGPSQSSMQHRPCCGPPQLSMSCIPCCGPPHLNAQFNQSYGPSPSQAHSQPPFSQPCCIPQQPPFMHHSHAPNPHCMQQSNSCYPSPKTMMFYPQQSNKMPCCQPSTEFCPPCCSSNHMPQESSNNISSSRYYDSHQNEYCCDEDTETTYITEYCDSDDEFQCSNIKFNLGSDSYDPECANRQESDLSG